MKKLFIMLFAFCLLSCVDNGSQQREKKEKMVLTYAIHYPDGKVVKEQEIEVYKTWTDVIAEVYVIVNAKNPSNGICLVPEPSRNPADKRDIGIQSLCPLEVISLKRKY